ncbi:MAG: pyridoxal phosphate-dependent aminotransferase [Planctomycetes bacterium]|nr:pyridoxal phosphate-dependent aminotransferase [Planctomycetota bacterium]
MRFSSRTPDDRAPNRFAVKLAERRAAGAALLDLTESNPTRAGFEYDGVGILAALADPRALRYEPAAAGPAAAREAVAEYYREGGVRVEPRDVLLTASTSEAYSWLFKLLAAPGERVLIPRPSYPLFDSLAALEGLEVGTYALLREDRWRLDAEDLRAALEPGTRAVVTVNPNNPTGSFLSAEEARLLADVASRAGAAVLSDEVFSDFAYGVGAGRAGSFAAAEDGLAFALSGLSKVCGLPQLKLGWLVVAGDAALRREARERLELVADTFLSVNTPVAVALPRLLAGRRAFQDQVRGRVGRNRAFLAETLGRAAGSRVLPAEGGWYAILEVPDNLTDEEWVLALLERSDVLVHPGYFFGIEEEAFLVASLLPPEPTFREGVERLRALVSERGE